MKTIAWGVAAGGAAFVASTLTLAVLSGQLSGWSPPATLTALSPSPPPAAPVPPGHPFERSAVTFPTSAGEVRGTVVAPTARTEVGIVLVAGSGPADADTLLPLAERFARSGIAAITYDKRTTGYDTFHRDYDRLADDALHAADALRRATGASRVGVFGISEGGWVASVAAGRRAEPPAFVVLASAPVVTPLQQVSWTVDNALRRAPTFVRRVAATVLSGGRSFVDYLDADATETLRRGTAPVFAVWGADDDTVPVNEAYRRLRRMLPPDRLASHIIPAAGHDLLAHTDRWLPAVVDWVHDPRGSAPAGVEPAPDLGVAEPPSPAWFTDPRLHLAVSLVLAVATGAFTSRRLRRVQEGHAS